MPAKSAGSRDTAGTLDPLADSAQWSRRFIGLKLFMALAQHGEAWYAETLERQARMSRMFASLWRLQDGASSIPRPSCCVLYQGWPDSASCWRLFENGRSRGCPRRNSAVLR